ncbi:MAG: RsmE family RNA methyltransferase [Oligoflexia bacterium]|nr:RsmE family RNA methyltransferase [Oligoflexia bacterium]
MHGIYLGEEFGASDLQLGGIITAEGERVFHLVRVLRVTPGEKIAIFNGRGEIWVGEVQKDTKSSILVVRILEKKVMQKMHNLDLAMGTTKREAFEEVVKMAVELGYQRLIPLKTTFSQRLKLNVERTERLVESAIIQSNNPFFLSIEPETTLQEVVKAYDIVMYFTEKLDQMLQKQNQQLWSGIEPLKSKILLIIGPEAGLSSEEETFLLSLKNSSSIHLPAYLMRCPTAVCTATGFVFSKLMLGKFA